MRLSPQQRKILHMLSDEGWHCPTKELVMKDDRKRISELRGLGFNIESELCKLHTNHESPVKMRRWIKSKPKFRIEYDPLRGIAVQMPV